MQYPRSIGPVGQNDQAPTDDASMWLGYHPDQPNVFLFLQSSIISPFDQTPAFDIPKGYQPPKPALFNTLSQIVEPIDVALPVIPLTDVPFFSQSLSRLPFVKPASITQLIDLDLTGFIYIVNPLSPRLFQPPQAILEQSQVVHQPDTNCKVEEFSGNMPSRPRLFIAPIGLFTTDFVFNIPLTFFGHFESYQPALGRLFLGPRIGLPFIDITQVGPTTPLSPEMMAGNHPDIPRLLLGARIPLPILQPQFDQSPISIEMFQGTFPQLARRFPNRPVIYDCTGAVPVPIGIQIGDVFIFLGDADLLHFFPTHGGFKI